jgi:hypothetical protein
VSRCGDRGPVNAFKGRNIMRRVGGQFLVVVAVLAMAAVGVAADEQAPLLENSPPRGADAKVMADAASVEAAGRTLALRPGRDVSTATVVVVGPDDIRFERRVEGEPELVLALEGPDGEALPDGAYRYELKMSTADGISGEPEVVIQRGTFKMRNGSVVLPDPAEDQLQGWNRSRDGAKISTGDVESSGRVEVTAGDAGAAEPVAKAAIHHADNVSIDGHLCVGCDVATTSSWPVGIYDTNELYWDTTLSGDPAQKNWLLFPRWSDDRMCFQLAGSGDIPFSIHQDAPDEALAVLANGDVSVGSGNVGIGTTTPAQSLHMVNTFTNPRIQFETPGLPGNQYWVDPGADGFWIWTGVGGPVATFPVAIQAGTPNNTIRTTVDGNVGIGLGVPTDRLHVFNGTGNASLRFDSAASANFWLDRGNLGSLSRFVFLTAGVHHWTVGMVNDGTSDFHFSRDTVNDAITIKRSNGYIGLGDQKNPLYPIHHSSGARLTAGGVWTDVSSRKYKENIRELDAEEALSALAGLNPVQFNYKNSPEEEYVGFIAEDVPAIVAMEDREGLSPMDLVGVLTKVVQEQQNLLQQQQVTINSLTSRVEELESR